MRKDSNIEVISAGKILKILAEIKNDFKDTLYL